MEDRNEVEPPGLGSGVTRPGQALLCSIHSFALCIIHRDH